MSFNLKKSFGIMGGTSVVTPELLRDDTTLTDTLNIDMYDNYGLSKRRGEELVEKFDGQGLAAFTMSNGDKIIIKRDSEGIIKISTFNLVVQYIGTQELRIEVGQEQLSSTDGKYIKFFKDEIEVARYSLGGESFDKTINDLLTEINVTDVTIFAGPLGIGSVNTDISYTLKPFNSVIPSNVDSNLEYESFEVIPGTIPNLGQISEKPIDTIERDGILYFTTPAGLYKYDGTSFYRAGLPKPDIEIIPVPTGYTGSNPKRYVYRVILTATDALGNIIESTPSDERTIIVDDATTFPNGIRSIGIGTTQLGNFNPSNVTYSVLRTKANGSIFFVVAEGLDINTDYVDVVDDENLVSDYTLPPFELNATTEGAYIDIWRNSLVMTGFTSDPDKVLYEDIIFTEGFSDSNSFLTQSRRGGPNTGIMAQDNALYVFKEESITLVTGDLNTSQFQVDKISEEGIGATSNLSIIEHNGRVWFMSKEGVHSISLEGLKEESGDLRPIFEKESNSSMLNNCVAFNNTLDGRLMFTLPNFDVDPANPTRNLAAKPITYVYNTQLDKWFIWDTIDFSRGISIKDNEVWYLGSNLDDVNNNAVYCRIPRTFTSIDFADRGLPIQSISKSNWETLGEPSVNKKFVRMKLYSIDNNRQKFETPDFTIDIETEHGYKYDDIVSQASLRFYELNNPLDSSDRTPVASRRVRLLPKKTKALRYILKNSELNKNILISGVEFEIAVEHAGFMRSE